jgi:hypothetical protein
MQTVSKQGRLEEALLNGEALTVPQIRSRFGIKNPTATISDIRFKGVPVYANHKKNSKGERVTVYRTGKASRAIVAAGYLAMSLGIA